MPSRAVSAGEPEPVEDSPTPLKRGRTTQEMLADRKGPGFFGVLLRTLVGLAIVAVLLVGVYFAASALDTKKVERAPWAAKSAPDVKPASLIDQ